MANRTDNAVLKLSLQQGRELLNGNLRPSPAPFGGDSRTRREAVELDTDGERNAMRVAMLLPVAG
jgi:hypothetical protein